MNNLNKQIKTLRLIALCEKYQGNSKKMIKDIISWREKLILTSTIERYIKEYTNKYENLTDVITYIDDEYPLEFKDISYPYPILFAHGNKELLKDEDVKIKMINCKYDMFNYFIVEKQLDNNLVDYCLLTSYFKNMPLALYEHLNTTNYNYVHHEHDEGLLEIAEKEYLQDFNYESLSM